MKQANKKQPIKVKQKAPSGIFERASVGRVSTKPLIHKNGSHYRDIEYFELLGRRCVEIEKANPNPNIPVDYQKYGFDRNVCEVAKTIVKAIDEKRPTEEIESYLQRCINIDE